MCIRDRDWDGRFSADNKQWAKTVPVSENPDAWGTDRNCYLAAVSYTHLIAIREALAERGIVNGQVVDAEANRNSPFVRQVMADVERIAAQEAQEKMCIRDRWYPVITLIPGTSRRCQTS